MSARLTTAELFSALGQRLALRWRAGQAGGERELTRARGATRATLLGHLNLISPNRIQVLGEWEMDYMRSDGLEADGHAMCHLFQSDCNLVILGEGLVSPPSFCAAADAGAIALFESTLPSDALVRELRHYLNARLAERTTLHGVYLDVLGIGVLISGAPGIGKSEVALELISRGHRLVADDAPEFTRIAPDRIEGRAPPMLRDFLEVRGLGLLNVRKMYGDSVLRVRKAIKLVVELRTMDPESEHHLNRLEGMKTRCEVLGVELEHVTIPVGPGRSLAVLVEAAVRNYILESQGYVASEDFSARQASAIKDS